jgi:hypothetical protein
MKPAQIKVAVLTTGQKFDNSIPANDLEVFEVGDQTAQQIESQTENTFGWITMFLEFEVFDLRLPCADDKGQ